MATSLASPSAAALRREERDHDLDLVESAIALVAGGGARRAALILRHGEQVLPEAQAAARQSGVMVRAIWRSEGGCDLVVEPVA